MVTRYPDISFVPFPNNLTGLTTHAFSGYDYPMEAMAAIPPASSPSTILSITNENRRSTLPRILLDFKFAPQPSRPIRVYSIRLTGTGQKERTLKLQTRLYFHDQITEVSAYICAVSLYYNSDASLRILRNINSLKRKYEPLKGDARRIVSISERLYHMNSYFRHLCLYRRREKQPQSSLGIRLISTTEFNSSKSVF